MFKQFPKNETYRLHHDHLADLMLNLPFIKLKKTKPENFDSVHLFSFFFFFFFITHNSKTIQYVWMLCILNNWSASGDHSYLFWALFYHMWHLGEGGFKLHATMVLFLIKQLREALTHAFSIPIVACQYLPHPHNYCVRSHKRIWSISWSVLDTAWGHNLIAVAQTKRVGEDP